MATKSTIPNGICYLEIPAPDPVKLKDFYAVVFGWNVELSGMGSDYWMFSDGKLSGGFTKAEQPSESGVLLYLSVDDIPAKLKSITKAGGTIIKNQTAVGGDHGVFAAFSDPCGNRVGMWSKR